MKNFSIYTVSQANHYLKNLLLKDSVLQDIFVLGEISNFKLHKPSGHMYFTLKDEGSIIRCVFFLSRNRESKFVPAEGMSVVARGNISLYERSGNYQLYVKEIKPEGVGDLYYAFEQLKEKLKSQGLFAVEHKKTLPAIPRCIGLITSPSGAAIKDFITAIERRFPNVHVLICPVAVQGKEASVQITDALKKMDRLKSVDVVVITRGGGSLEELWPFNDENLARAIFEMETPVVSAVGHETDFTIADFVADRRASTPTAAAEMITPERDELLRYLKVQERRLKNFLKTRLQQKKLVLDNFSRSLSIYHPRDKINQGYQQIDEIWQRLSRNFSYNLKLKESLLGNIEEKLQVLSPLKIMSRGYAFVTDEKDGIIGSANCLKEEQEINVIFHDGEAACRVKKIKKKHLTADEKRI
ncbi:MAG: exodeoxyribonuclease VII large subunit [Firmicutes bacterium]|nr:exodeoxyribonuclease VII large subunit [Bacillota bacterium]